MSTLSSKTNQYAVAALREERAILAGTVAELEAQLHLKQGALVHLDAVLRMFDPGADPAAIPVRRPKRHSLYPIANLTRRITDILRRKGSPMTTPEVVEALACEVGFDAKGAAAIAGRVRFTLRNLAKGTGPVLKHGTRAGARWSLR